MTFNGNSPFGAPSQPGSSSLGSSFGPPPQPGPAATPRASSPWATVAWILVATVITVILGAGAAFVEDSRGGSTAGETSELTSVPLLPPEETGESEPSSQSVAPSTTSL